MRNTSTNHSKTHTTHTLTGWKGSKQSSARIPSFFNSFSTERAYQRPIGPSTRPMVIECIILRMRGREHHETEKTSRRKGANDKHKNNNTKKLVRTTYNTIHNSMTTPTTSTTVKKPYLDMVGLDKPMTVSNSVDTLRPPLPFLVVCIFHYGARQGSPGAGVTQSQR